MIGMRIFSICFLIVLLLPGCGAQTQSLSTKDVERELGVLRKALEAKQRDTTDVITDPNLMSLHLDPRFRELIKEFAVVGRTRITPEGEPGEPLTISGVVINGDGKALSGALLNIYQTDVRGFYTPQHAMDEPHARLFAYIRTDSSGKFEFLTIRPGEYPQTVRIDGQEQKIPGHIHVDVSAPNHQPRKFQLVFADEPLTQTAYWQQWASRYGHPIITLKRDAGGRWTGACSLVLSELK